MTQRAYQVYLAGPMSNRPGFNFHQFFDAASYLRLVKGWQVLSPAEKDLEQIPWEEMQLIPGFDTGDLATYVANSSFTMSNAMEWDLPAILQSDGIVLLDEWETSTGARWERAVAEALDRDIWLLHDTPGDTGLHEWELVKDEEPKQLTNFMKRFGERAECIPVVRNATVKPGHAYLVEGDIDTLRQAEAIFQAITDPPIPSGEVRVVDPKTGGAKGTKLARFDLLPYDALWELAEHYGRGARKYAERNWELGYPWSLSFAAAMRHLTMWWDGVNIDDDPSLLDEDGIPRSLHITAAAWHVLNLVAFTLRHAGTDDRPPAFQ